MRRSIWVVFATAVLMGTLGSGAGAAAATAPAKPVPVKEWSGSVCTHFSRWEARLAKLGATATPADPTAAKKVITKFLTGAVKATEKLARQLREDGVPKVEDGNAIAATFASSVNSLRASYAEAQTAAGSLATTDAAAFSTAVEGLAAQLQMSGGELASALSQAAGQYPSSVLDKAFANAEACANLA